MNQQRRHVASEDRARQFLPFDALQGFGELVGREQRATEADAQRFDPTTPVLGYAEDGGCENDAEWLEWDLC